MEEKTSRNAASSGAVRTPFLALPGAPLQRLELSAWKMTASPAPPACPRLWPHR